MTIRYEDIAAVYPKTHQFWVLAQEYLRVLLEMMRNELINDNTAAGRLTVLPDADPNYQVDARAYSITLPSGDAASFSLRTRRLTDAAQLRLLQLRLREST